MQLKPKNKKAQSSIAKTVIWTILLIAALIILIIIIEQVVSRTLI